MCGAYDAMVSGRPYKQAMEPDAALAELRGNAGTQFDPQVVECFCDCAGELQRVPLQVA